MKSIIKTLFGRTKTKKQNKDVYSFPSGNEVTITSEGKEVSVHSSIWAETERELHFAVKRLADDEGTRIANAILADCPRHEHDCEKCIWLGRHEKYDLYFCEQENLFPTVIARFGDGGDYLSGMEFATKDCMPLFVAKNSAISLALLKTENENQ